MKYGHPTLLRHPIWVSLESDKEVKFLIKPLSYAQVYGMNEYFYSKDKLNSITHYIPFDTLVDSILDFRGIHGFASLDDILKALSADDKAHLELTLYTISSLTNAQLSNIDNLIDLMLSPTLQEATYSCDKCKTIPGMQQARNCPLIELKEKAKFKLRVGDKTYTECPISDLDTYVINQIIQANNFISINSLPLSGGMSEQSVWFVLVVQRYKNKLNALRASN